MVDNNIAIENIGLNQEKSIVKMYSIQLALKMIPEFSGNCPKLYKFISCVDIVNVRCMQ